MLRRTALTKFAATRAVLSEGGDGSNFSNMWTSIKPSKWQDKDYPNMPHDIGHSSNLGDGILKNPVLNKLMDQNVPMYDDIVSGCARVHWQEPAKIWNNHDADDTIILQEHDKEEWNDKPYIGVSHLYEPPYGSEERPIRIESNGNPGDNQITVCFGSCAPHVPAGNFYFQMKGYAVNKCPMCQQHYYIHNRPWLVMHPDWTDEPAADEGPAFTFAEIESEFDRDFHEFAVYLNAE